MYSPLFLLLLVSDSAIPSKRLAGSPFLWESIEIYRAPLPFEDIASLSERMHSNPLQFPCKFRAIFIGFDSKPPEELSHVGDSIFNGITRLTSKAPQCGSCSSYFSVLVAFDTDSGGFQSRINPTSDYCGEIRSVDLDADDDTVDDKLEFALGKSYQTGGKWYTVVVVNGHAGFKAVIGKYRHAWIVGNLSEEQAALKLSEICVTMFMNAGIEEA